MKKNQQSGQVILIAIIFFAVMLTMAAIVLSYATQYVRAERQTVASTQALRLAEAGIDQAVYQLNQNGAYGGESDTAVTPGTFTTSVTTLDGNTKQITSTGYVPNSTSPIASRTVKIDANVNSSVVSFRYGVQVGAGGITMGNGSIINGNLFSNGSVSGGGRITIDTIVAGGTAPNPDQQWTTQNSSFNLGDSSAHADVAQSFAPGVTNTLNKVSLYLKKVGNPTDITIKITSDNSGVSNNTALATGTLAASTVTNSFGFIDAGFASLPALTAGTKYWIIAIASVNSSNYFVWGEDNTDSYASNTGKYSSNWSSPHPSWTAVGGDLDFETYMGGTNTSISGVTVSGNATANTLTNCTVAGDAYYQTLSNCTVGGTPHPNTADTAPQPMPISDAQISAWEAMATAGGVISGSYSINGVESIGPKEIDGDLTVNGTISLTGPVWVKGDINFSNGSKLTVNASTGNNGAVLIADATGNTAVKGIANLSNNMIISGNGNAGSYPMVISTNTGPNAIIMGNNANSIILYAAKGTVSIINNATANQLTGYAISMANNTTVTYTTGLQGAGFSNGPGGSWVYLAGTFIITK